MVAEHSTCHLAAVDSSLAEEDIHPVGGNSLVAVGRYSSLAAVGCNNLGTGLGNMVAIDLENMLDQRRNVLVAVEPDRMVADPQVCSAKISY